MPIAVMVSSALLLYFVLDVVLTEDAQVRNLPKLVWLVLVVVLPVIGGLAWFVAGRPEDGRLAPGGAASRGGTTGRRPSSPGSPPRPHTGRQRGQARGDVRRAQAPRGPDDDPDFLRAVEERLRRDAAGSEPDDPTDDPTDDGP